MRAAAHLLEGDDAEVQTTIETLWDTPFCVVIVRGMLSEPCGSFLSPSPCVLAPIVRSLTMRLQQQVCDMSWEHEWPSWFRRKPSIFMRAASVAALW